MRPKLKDLFLHKAKEKRVKWTVSVISSEGPAENNIHTYKPQNTHKFDALHTLHWETRGIGRRHLIDNYLFYL